MYERLRLVITGLCVIAVGVAIFDRALALLALAAILGVVILVAITGWVIRGGTNSDSENADPQA